jgi:hypothetical protein
MVEERVPFDETQQAAAPDDVADTAQEPAKQQPEQSELEKLQAQLLTERQARVAFEEKQQNLERMLHASEKAISELREGADEGKLEALEARKREITDGIVAAHSAGDVRTDLQLRDELSSINDEIRQAKVPRSAPAPEQPDVMQNPEYRAWLGKNPWFGTDAAMSGAALALMQELNNSGKAKGWTPTQRFEYVENEVKQRFNMGRRGVSKVEGGRNEGGYGGGESGNGYEDMPVEAKRACDSYARRFVGKQDANGNIKYKTLADYRAHYASDYFDESWGAKQMNRYQ